jgi:hypothetical protein
MIKETGYEMKESELFLCVHDDTFSLHGRCMKAIVAHNYCSSKDGKGISIKMQIKFIYLRIRFLFLGPLNIFLSSAS